MIAQQGFTYTQIRTMCRKSPDMLTAVVAVMAMSPGQVTMSDIFKVCEHRYARHDLSTRLQALAKSKCLHRKKIKRPRAVRTGPARVWAYERGPRFKEWQDSYIPAGLNAVRPA